MFRFHAFFQVIISPQVVLFGGWVPLLYPNADLVGTNPPSLEIQVILAHSRVAQRHYRQMIAKKGGETVKRAILPLDLLIFAQFLSLHLVCWEQLC